MNDSGDIRNPNHPAREDPGTGIENLLQIMARLRDPENGCAWDRAQTFESIAPYTVEEAYETADAISRGDMAELVSELGDLLFHVVFHAQMAEEAGLFGFRDVVTSIVDKMIRRHPHVFAREETEQGHARPRSLTDEVAAWEVQKARERGRAAGGKGALDGITKGLPPGHRALKLQKKAAAVRFDWAGPRPVLEKLREETEELDREIHRGDGDAIRDEMGDVLFTCVNLARHLDVDPDEALRGANRKFERRFRRMEELLRARGRTPADCGPEELDGAWEEVKSEES